MVRPAKRANPSIAHEQPTNKKRRKSTLKTLAQIRGRLGELSIDELDRHVALRNQAYLAACNSHTRKKNALQEAERRLQILKNEVEGAESQEIAAREFLANVSAARQARQAMATEEQKHIHLKSLEKELQRLKDEEAANKDAAETRMTELDGIDLEALFAKPEKIAMVPQHHQEERHENDHEHWGQDQPQENGESQSSLSSLQSQSSNGVQGHEDVDLYSADG